MSTGSLRFRVYLHSSRPNVTRKSFVVLSAPLPVADPGGKGAGTRPQLLRLILRALIQYSSLVTRPNSMFSAADFSKAAAFLKALSLLPTTSWASKAWTDGIGGCLVTTVAVNADGGSCVTNEGCGDVWLDI